MDWIRENKSLATIVGIFLVGGLAIGGVLLMSHFAYGASLEQLESISGKVAMQEKASLYPSQDNLDKLVDKVSGYEDAVSSLGGVLLKLQQPAKDITDTDFVAHVKTRIADVRQKAATASIKLPKDFAFGFDAYTRGLPPTPEAARQLNDYFENVDAVVVAALDAGIASLDSLVRSELVVEKPNAPAPAPAPAAPSNAKAKAKSTKSKSKSKAAAKPPREIAKVVERRQLNLSMTCDQRSFQTLTNVLASPSKMPYFTVVRVVRVENEKQEGPLRNAPMPLHEPAPTPPNPTETPNATPGAPPAAEVIIAPKPAAPDAIAVLGKEMLKVSLEIDLVRFLAPAPAAN